MEFCVVLDWHLNPVTLWSFVTGCLRRLAGNVRLSFMISTGFHDNNFMNIALAWMTVVDMSDTEELGCNMPPGGTPGPLLHYSTRTNRSVLLTFNDGNIIYGPLSSYSLNLITLIDYAYMAWPHVEPLTLFVGEIYKHRLRKCRAVIINVTVKFTSESRIRVCLWAVVMKPDKIFNWLRIFTVSLLAILAIKSC